MPAGSSYWRNTENTLCDTHCVHLTASSSREHACTHPTYTCKKIRAQKRCPLPSHTPNTHTCTHTRTHAHRPLATCVRATESYGTCATQSPAHPHHHQIHHQQHVLHAFYGHTFATQYINHSVNCTHGLYSLAGRAPAQ